MHRFYLPQSLQVGETVVVERALAHQLKSVLRLQVGDKIRVFGEGREFDATLLSLEEKQGTLVPEAEVTTEVEPRTQLTLYMALIKGEKFDWVLQKATELGVAAIVPVLTRRTVKTHLNPERARRILIEATEQCGRRIVPTLAPMTRYDEALRMAAAPGFIAYEAESAVDLTAVAPQITAAGEVRLFIGPEGGFDSDEIAFAVAAGVRSFSLGPRILRAETAAIAGVGLFMYLCGEYQLA